MDYGYARVSTEDQNPDLQVRALTEAGCPKVLVEKMSGASLAKRPVLTRCLKQLKAGDCLTVWKMDRLGRSLRDVISILDDFRARGVRFRSLTEAVDTESPMGRAMWQLLGVFSELEKSLILERCRAGRQAAKARGVKLGRKSVLSREQVQHARALYEQGKKADDIADLLKCSRATLYRVLSTAA